MHACTWHTAHNLCSLCCSNLSARAPWPTPATTMSGPGVENKCKLLARSGRSLDRLRRGGRGGGVWGPDFPLGGSQRSCPQQIVRLPSRFLCDSCVVSDTSEIVRVDWENSSNKVCKIVAWKVQGAGRLHVGRATLGLSPRNLQTPRTPQTDPNSSLAATEPTATNR